MVRRLSHLLTVGALVLTLATAGCSSGKSQRHAQGKTPPIDLGTIATLAPSSSPEPGPVLSAPSKIIRVPQSYPLGAVVHFSVPIANTGDAPLLISGFEPG